MSLVKRLRSSHRRLAIAVLSCVLFLPLLGQQAGGAPSAHAASGPQVVFGMGTEASGARTASLVTQAPVKILTSWYNGSSDLNWMSGWQTTEVPRDYAAGYALQLIVYAGGSPSGNMNTAYGPACGRTYPLSSGFLSDMTRLAQIFNGSGRLYVSMFAEFQTYACQNNQWSGSSNYWRALKDQYRAALAIFHRYAPNSRVSLCWGGWQASWNGPSTGAGLSLFPYFADVMSISDYQSFQAMNTSSNVAEIQQMTSVLHQWGRVMVAYYQPNNNSQSVFDADMYSMLNSSFLGQETANGLFAFCFMNSSLINSWSPVFGLVKSAVQNYGGGPLY
jgi:hypothetical protein